MRFCYRKARVQMAVSNLPALGRARLSTLAVDELRARIIRGDWKPGDRLPSERQLSDQLGMSRSSLREAIRGLEAMGFVDVRHGQGVFVRERDADDGGDASFANWSAEHRYSIGELVAFRLLVEPELAALAAENADGPFIADLEAIMAAMEEAAARGDLAVLVQLDTAFHDAITGHAGNQLYRDLLGYVGHLSIDSRRISLGVSGRAPRVVDRHNLIVQAIRAGDADRAWAAMREHLERFAADMRIHPVG